VSSDLEELDEVVQLSVHVSADGDWAAHGLHVALLHQHLLRLPTNAMHRTATAQNESQLAISKHQKATKPLQTQPHSEAQHTGTPSHPPKPPICRTFPQSVHTSFSVSALQL
jgi:hypothetical protein